MESEIVVKVRKLRKWFAVRGGMMDLLRGTRRYLKAVDDISFDVHRREILGLVGESGCGKTTTGRLLARLTEPTNGHIHLWGRDLARAKGSELRTLRKDVQMVFQDPYSSLTPRMTVEQLLKEPLIVHKIIDDPREIRERVCKALESVGLSPSDEFLPKYSHEMSGGQRQRVAIARSLMTGPKFVVFDEPVSMLDVSVRAGILAILYELKENLNLSEIFITHDLAVARQICDRIAVMYSGKIVEVGPAEELIDNPLHPYSQALISAIPAPDPESTFNPMLIRGETPDAVNPPSGCRFYARCPNVMTACSSVEPKFTQVQRDRYVACHTVIQPM